MLMKLLPILVVTLLYGLIYAAIHRADPTAFGFENGVIDPFYFSFTTMSSVGYGDYSPKTNTAKIVVMSQQFILIGQIIELLGLDKMVNRRNNNKLI
jgi:voltage-gated potassium channel